MKRLSCGHGKAIFWSCSSCCNPRFFEPQQNKADDSTRCLASTGALNILFCAHKSIFWCFEELLSLFKDLHYNNLVFGIEKKFYNDLMRSETNNEVVLYCAALPTTSESSRLGRQEVRTLHSECCTCCWLYSFPDQDDELSSILYLTPTLQTFHSKLLSVYLLCIMFYSNNT